MTVAACLFFVALLAPSLLAQSEPGRPARLRFEEISQKAGVSHVHHIRTFKGKKGDVLGMFTSGGASVAVTDYDGDGWDDFFLTDSQEGEANRLYRNRGNGTFADVTQSAGVGGGNDARSIVADALWFDYDNDGRADLLVVRFGTPLLYHNQGGGNFKDVSATSGLNKFGNTVAAIAFDYDRDGYLDLMLGNYFKSENLLDLKTPHVLPNDLDNAVNGGGVTLWRGDGHGRFTEVTEKAGFARHSGWTLDIGHGDFDNDGLQDVYLACDYGTDRIFFNNGDGSFRETTEKALGYDTKKGMNAEAADYDNDGWLDIYVTNITDEYMKECNMLWHNNHDGTFTDLSKETGTCDTLWGWGAKFGDFDNDAWQDLFAVNGLRSAGKDNFIPVLVNMIITPGIDFTDINNWPDIGDMSWSGFQKKKLFLNLGADTFKEMSADAGVDNDLDGRGVALADFDNDGLLDIFQTNANQRVLLYHNQSPNPGRWVGLKLVGTKSNRDAIGTRVTLRAGNRSLIREVSGGNGYSAQSSTRLHFGLGAADRIESLEIRWPSGLVQKLDVPLDRISYIKEGTGMIAAPAASEGTPK
ncbi:MAG: CRTAC1 family protein [Acidobacteria bacterium]|nr:CRTAC1 family protein [Acidobacteriota bacterium]